MIAWVVNLALHDCCPNAINSNQSLFCNSLCIKVKKKQQKKQAEQSHFDLCELRRKSIWVVSNLVIHNGPETKYSNVDVIVGITKVQFCTGWSDAWRRLSDYRSGSSWSTSRTASHWWSTSRRQSVFHLYGDLVVSSKTACLGLTVNISKLLPYYLMP